MYAARVLLGVAYLYTSITCFASEPKSNPKEYGPRNPQKPRTSNARQLTYHNKRRNNNLFQGLLQIGKPSGQNFLMVLKNSGGYNTKELRWRPPFTYEKPSHPSLIELRKHYKLEAVAGGGNELSRIKRLLNWAHKIIPYDGTRTVPAARNAESIISASQKNNCGFDCRGLATILNEAYLSMGFESRLLTCLPRDTTDREHHVITMVFSRTLNKWLWMDPSNNAYLTDEDGTILGVNEVRDRLIGEKKIYINADANLNNKAITLKQYVYDYMTKNLYWFQSPLHSGFDTETQTTAKEVDYVALFPSTFTPYGLEDIRVRGGTAYMTTNSEYFWQKPRTSTILAPSKKERRKR